MCFSGIGQIVFGIIMIACFVLTCASMFSDNWRTFKSDAEDTIKSGIFSFNCHIPGSSGAAQSCDSSEWWNSLKTWEKVTVVAMCLAVATELLCLAWNLFACFACCCKKHVIHPLTLFATLVAIFLAVGVIVYGVNNKDALACAQKKIRNLFNQALIMNSSLVEELKSFEDCLLDIEGYPKIKKLIESADKIKTVEDLFGILTNGTIRTIFNGEANKNLNLDNGQWKKSEVGYSFYLAVAALVLAVVDIFIAGLTVCLAEKCC